MVTKHLFITLAFLEFGSGNSSLQRYGTGAGIVQHMGVLHASPVDPHGPTDLPSGPALSNLIVHRSRHDLPTPTNWWQTGEGTSYLVVLVRTVDSLNL